MKIIFTLFLAIFLVSCGKTVENKVENTKTGSVENIATGNTETKSENISKNSEEKNYTLTIQEKTGEDIAGFDSGFSGNLKFSEKTDDGEKEFEYNISVLGNEKKLESLVVAYIPKENEDMTTPLFNQMSDLGYNISEKIEIGSSFKDISEMNVSNISEHEILALAIKDFFKQISEK